jgi:hypothetical protein
MGAMCSLFSCCAIALSCAIFIGDAFYIRHAAKIFLQDLKNLDAAAVPTTYFRTLQRKYGNRFKGEKCSSDTCFDELVIDNRFLSIFHLFPKTEIHAQFTLGHNSLGTVLVEYTSGIFKENSPTVGIQEDFCDLSSRQLLCDGFFVDPHGRDVTRVWNGSVEIGQAATQKQKQAAFALNLGCLTAFSGCKDISELLPAMWKRTHPGAVSSRLRAMPDSIADESRPLPE